MRVMKKVLLTGSTGFVGNSLRTALKLNYSLLATSRLAQMMSDGSQTIGVGDLSAETRWTTLLKDVDIVVHVAGRAHKLNDRHEDPLAAFRKVNVDATLNLARQAADCGVKRFIFISSIGVHGSVTNNSYLSERSPLTPHADYAVSKLEAEKGLQDISSGSAMEVVVLRPPLIYAGNAPGNFGLLLKLIASGAPLPFLNVDNKRSMVALENFVDLVQICLEHDAAANRTFLVSDGVDVSTTQIIQYIARGMGRDARLFYLPDMFVRMGAALLGRKTTYEQLYGSLAIDSRMVRDILSWCPPTSPEEALFKAGEDYVSRGR